MIVWGVSQAAVGDGDQRDMSADRMKVPNPMKSHLEIGDRYRDSARFTQGNLDSRGPAQG